MYNTIAKFLETKGTIYDCQFGFRTNHSTQHAIITLVEKITKSVDSGDIVINLFVDLRKAFDTVSHSIFVKKLHAYGIRGNILELCVPVIWKTKRNLSPTIEKIQKPNTSHVAFHRALFLAPYFYCLYERHFPCL